MSLENIVQLPWPEQDGKYKVVQLMIDEKPYLRFGKLGESSINLIIKEFAREIGAKTKIDLKKCDPPLLFDDENRYKIIGAGRCELLHKPNIKERLAEFYGLGFTHEKGIDQNHFKLVMEICKKDYPDMNITYNPQRTK